MENLTCQSQCDTCQNGNGQGDEESLRLRLHRFLYGDAVSKIPRLPGHYHFDMCRIVIGELNFPWLKFPVKIVIAGSRISRDPTNTEESGMELKHSRFILYHGVSN